MHVAVTGASAGIGEALVCEYVASGAAVALPAGALPAGASHAGAGARGGPPDLPGAERGGGAKIPRDTKK